VVSVPCRSPVSGVERSSPVFDDAVTELSCLVTFVLARSSARLLERVLRLRDIFAVGQVQLGGQQFLVCGTATPIGRASDLALSRQHQCVVFLNQG